MGYYALLSNASRAIYHEKSMNQGLASPYVVGLVFGSIAMDSSWSVFCLVSLWSYRGEYHFVLCIKMVEEGVNERSCNCASGCFCGSLLRLEGLGGHTASR